MPERREALQGGLSKSLRLSARSERLKGLAMERASATQIADQAIKGDIRRMLDELGHPPLVDRIFPNGWEKESSDKLQSLHALCLRTFDAREQEVSS